MANNLLKHRLHIVLMYPSHTDLRRLGRRVFNIPRDVLLDDHLPAATAPHTSRILMDHIHVVAEPIISNAGFSSHM